MTTLLAGIPFADAMDSWRMSVEGGFAIPQDISGRATLTSGTVQVSQDVEDKIKLAHRLGAMVLYRAVDAAPGSRLSWLIGLGGTLDRYDVHLVDPGEDEYIKGDNLSLNVMAGPSWRYADGCDLALLAIGGGVHATYDDRVVRNDGSSLDLEGHGRGWSYGASLLATVALTDHLFIGAAGGYLIGHLNQYGPIIIDLGPSWPDPGTRVSEGRIDAQVESHAWIVSLSLGVGW
jgi:hypothetical protein